MKLPTIHFIHNRKGNTDRKARTPIEMRVTYARRSVYVSTGYSCLQKYWDQANEAVRGGQDALAVNTALEMLRRRAFEISAAMVERGQVDIQALARQLRDGGAVTETFVAYAARRIRERADIRESTRRAHGKLLGSLREFGRIETFSDLTHANVQAFYDWLLRRRMPDGGTMKAASAWSHMKLLRVYIHDAMAAGLMDSDPSAGIKVSKGEPEPGRWLSMEELRALEEAPLEGHIARVRDLFVVQCYSGLAYADLMDLTADKIEAAEGGLEVLVGHRLKTGEEHMLVVHPELRTLLDRYGGRLPRISNQKYNDYLKALAARCGIDKPLSSHWGRRTCGMLMLNRGFPIEIVAKALGHKNIRVTQQAYARLIRQGVVDAYLRVVGTKKPGA